VLDIFIFDVYILTKLYNSSLNFFFLILGNIFAIYLFLFNSYVIKCQHYYSFLLKKSNTQKTY